MRNWKNVFFPLLTCLIALGLALLPLQLSIQEDGQLSGVVHSEALGEDSNFPAKVPELAGRVRLLAQLQSLPDALTVMDQELEGAALDEAAGQVREELRRLAAAGVFPEAAAENLTDFSGNRVYVRNRSDLSSASFLEMNVCSESEGTLFWLFLDGETGQALALHLYGIPMKKYPARALEIGKAFMEGWDVKYTELKELGESALTAMFFLPESQAQYVVDIYAEELYINPGVDWALLEKMARENELSDAVTDAALGYG